jgi:hypothetical protein
MSFDTTMCVFIDFWLQNRRGFSAVLFGYRCVESPYTYLLNIPFIKLLHTVFVSRWSVVSKIIHLSKYNFFPFSRMLRLAGLVLDSTADALETELESHRSSSSQEVFDSNNNELVALNRPCARILAQGFEKGFFRGLWWTLKMT